MITFHNLKRKLREETALEITFDVLTSITRDDSDKLQDILGYRFSFLRVQEKGKIGTVTHDQFAADSQVIFRNLVDLIGSFDETDFIEKWEKSDTLLAFFGLEEEEEEEGIEESELEELTESYSDKIILTNFDPNHPSAELLDRLLLKCQDAMGIEDLDTAEKYALEAKEIDHTSPQIYEYLARINFMKTAPNSIIKQAVSGNGEFLKRILQYVKRFHQFEHNFLEGANEKAQRNIAHIGGELARAVKAIYKVEDKPTRDKIWNMVLYYKQICEQMFMPQAFLEIAILELSNGGKVDWLKVEGETIKDRGYEFPALAMREDLKNKFIELLTARFGISNEDAIAQVNKRLRENFYFRNYNEYRRIRMERNADTGRYVWTLDQREEIIQFMHVARIGYLMFNDSKFLEAPYRELIGEEKMEWFELTATGELRAIHHLDSKRFNFDPFPELRFFAEKLGRDLEQEKILILDRLVSSLDDRTRKEFKRIHEFVKAYAQDGAKTDTEINRSQLFRAMSWTLLLLKKGQGKPELVHKMVDRSLKELAGDGTLPQWIVIGENGLLHNGPSCERWGLDAVSMFKAFLAQKDKAEWSKPLSSISSEFLTEYEGRIQSSYSKIPDNELRSGLSSYRIPILELLQEMENLFWITGSPRHLKSILDELTGKGRLDWLQQLASGVWIQLGAVDFLGLNVLGQYLRIVEISSIVLMDDADTTEYNDPAAELQNRTVQKPASQPAHTVNSNSHEAFDFNSLVKGVFRNDK